MMLERIKLLLNINDNYKNNLLNELIDNAKSFAVSYCRLAQYNSNLDFAVVRMVIEDYNRIGGEGIDNQSFSGMSETFANNYSEQVFSILRKYRRIKVI